jgi:multiple antibiotic resistance protein
VLALHHVVTAFLLGFPALFSIVNPIGGAFIFREATEERRHDRPRLARQVAFYSIIIMAVALWAGSFVLGFFGVSLSALRIGGGLVVATSGWSLLNAPERHEAQKEAQAGSDSNADDIALFPLTIPFTTGPGAISVAIALGAESPRDAVGLAWFFTGITGAILAVAAVVWVAYTLSDRISHILGPRGSRIITRLAAFLLLCIGVQIMLTGIEDVLQPLLAPHSLD